MRPSCLRVILPRANRCNNVCKFGRDRQAAEGAHVCASRISLRNETDCRQNSCADHAQHLRGKFSWLALAHRPTKHLPMHPDMLARRGLSQYMGPFETFETACEVAPFLARSSRRKFCLHIGSDATIEAHDYWDPRSGRANLFELPRSHARYPAAATSYVRQNIGHQAGTPGFAINCP